MIQGVIFLVGLLVGVCLVVGVLLALVVVVATQDIDAAVGVISTGYYVVVGLMPIALWFALYISHDDPEYGEAYDSLLRAVLTTLQGAVVGSILGAGPIFMAAVIYLPVILTGLSVDTFGSAVRDVIIWQRLVWAVAAAVISAIPLGMWAFYTGSGQDDL